MTRILVVDDQPNIVDMLATVLRFHGFVVDTAGTAAEALRQAAEQRPDLVLLDVMLPDGDGDGRDVCWRLRRDGRGRRAHGGDNWITKPFDVDLLLARVRAVLRPTGGTAVADRVLYYADVTLDPDTVRDGPAATGVVITSAALIMVRVFATFALSSASVVKMIGLDLAVSACARSGRYLIRYGFSLAAHSCRGRRTLPLTVRLVRLW